MNHFLGFIFGCLVDKFGVRPVVIFGAFLSVIGFTFSAFGTNIYFTIVGYGVIAGEKLRLQEQHFCF